MFTIRMRWLAALSLTGLASFAVAQPASDTCGSAPVIAVNTTANSDTFDATSEVQMTCGFFDSLDVWYRFTAAAAGEHTFTVSSFDMDPTVAVYSGCSGFPIVCNDDIAFPDDLDARVSINMVVGQTVRIRIAGNDETEGDFSLTVGGPAGTSLPNDACDSAGVIALTLNVPATGANFGANTSVAINPASCGGFVGSDGAADVFYRFTPAASASYSIDTCSSNFDTVLAIFDGCPVSQNNLLACNDDASPMCPNSETNSRINSIALTAGRTYLVRLAGYRGATPSTGTYTLLVSQATPVSGACCRGATCTVTLPSACTGFAARFVAAATVCNAGGSTTTPCCTADFNKDSSVTVQDIFDFLSAYFIGNANADVNGADGVTVGDIFAYLVAYFGPAC